MHGKGSKGWLEAELCPGTVPLRRELQADHGDGAQRGGRAKWVLCTHLPCVGTAQQGCGGVSCLWKLSGLLGSWMATRMREEMVRHSRFGATPVPM